MYKTPRQALGVSPVVPFTSVRTIAIVDIILGNFDEILGNSFVTSAPSNSSVTNPMHPFQRSIDEYTISPALAAYHVPGLSWKYVPIQRGGFLPFPAMRSRISPVWLMVMTLNSLSASRSGSITFVLGHGSGACFEIPAGVNAQTLQPYQPGDPAFTPLKHRIAVNAVLPASLPAGEWTLALWMPDSRERLRLRADYAIRLANNLEWCDWGGRGVNTLGTLLVTRAP